MALAQTNNVSVSARMHIHVTYEDRLEQLNLWSLEDSRTRADLIEVFKVIHGLSSIKFSTFIEYSTYDCTMGHSLKLVKKRARLDLQQHSSVNEP